MKRTVLLLSISVLAILISGWVNLAEAQQTGKVYRIGYLSTQSPSAELSRLDGFRQALRDLGYVEGKTDRLPEFAAELIRLKVDVMVTGCLAMHRLTLFRKEVGND